MKIEIEVSDKNEGTSYPWWMIIDPRQMTKPDPSFVAMAMIEGPFFSREEAVMVFRSNRHKFSKNAVVWCHSGHMTIQYREKIKEAEESARKENVR